MHLLTLSSLDSLSLPQMYFRSLDRKKQFSASDLDRAKRFLEIPFSSSDEEKLEAIEIIISVDSSDSIRLLQSAFCMVKEPLQAQKSKSLASVMAGGLVANSAAIALAQSKNEAGINFLIDTANSQTSTSIQKEIALRALYSTNDPKVLDTILSALNHKESNVIKSALEGCLVFLKNSPDKANKILECIYPLAFSTDYTNDVILKAYGLFITYATTEAIEFLKQDCISSYLTRADDLRARFMALLEIEKYDAYRALSEMLLLDLPEESWYQKIADKLIQQQFQDAKIVANEIVLKNKNTLRFLTHINSRKKVIYQARLRAAQKILQST